MDGVYALAMIALTVVIGVPLGLKWARGSRQRGQKAPLPESVYFDLSDDADLPDMQELIAALDGRGSVWHVGKMARTAITQLEEAATARERLLEVIDSRFDPGSITNEKFRLPAEDAYSALVRNAAALSNRVQDFDGREFSRMRKIMADGAYRQDDVPDAIQEARWSVLSRDYDVVERIVKANGLILAELSKLEKELASLSSDDAAAESEKLAAELDELSGHVKYYR